jgi:hypothetical protein
MPQHHFIASTLDTEHFNNSDCASNELHTADSYMEKLIVAELLKNFRECY